MIIHHYNSITDIRKFLNDCIDNNIKKSDIGFCNIFFSKIKQHKIPIIIG